MAPIDTSRQVADGAQNKFNVFEMQLYHEDILGAEDRKYLVTIRKLLLSTRVNRELFSWFFGSVSVQVQYITVFFCIVHWYLRRTETLCFMIIK